MANPRRSLFFNALILTASGIGLQLLGFGYRVFLSWRIGADGMGVFALVMPAYSVMLAVTLSGVGTAVTAVASERSALGDRAGTATVVRTAVLLFLGLFATSAVLVFAFSGWISTTLLGDADTELALLLLLPCLLFTGIENIVKSFFYGVHDVRSPALSDQMEQLVRIAAVAALLLVLRPQDSGTAAALIVAGMIISEIFSSSFLSAMYRRWRRAGNGAKPQRSSLPVGTAGNAPVTSSRANNVAVYRRRSSFPAETTGNAQAHSLLGKLAAMALPVAAAAVANNLLSSANTVLIPQRLMAAGFTQTAAVSALGVMMGMALPLFMIPMAFVGPIATLMLPQLTESTALRNTADVRRNVSRAIQVTGLLSLPVIAILSPLGPPICRLIYNQNIPEEHFWWLAAGSALVYYQVITTSLLNGVGRQNRAMVHNVLGGIVQLVFTWFAVGDPRFGLTGFLMGYVADAAIVFVLNMRDLARFLRLEMDWAAWFVMPVLAALISGFATSNVFQMCVGTIGQTPAMLAGIGTGAVFFALTLRIQGIDALAYLRKQLPRTHGRAARLQGRAGAEGPDQAPERRDQPRRKESQVHDARLRIR